MGTCMPSSSGIVSRNGFRQISDSSTSLPGSSHYDSCSCSLRCSIYIATEGPKLMYAAVPACRPKIQHGRSRQRGLDAKLTTSRSLYSRWQPIAGRAWIQRSVDKATFGGIEIQYGFLDRRRLDFGWWNCWVMKRRTKVLFRSDTEIAASTLYMISSKPVLLSGVGISCYLSCLRGGREHRYLSTAGISVRQNNDKPFSSGSGRPTSDIYHFITSELNRRTFGDLREHIEGI